MIFWFCAGMAATGLLFLAGLIFLPYPKEHEQAANVALGFITGTFITAAIQYLTGGTPTIKKTDNNTSTVLNTGDSPTPTVTPKDIPTDNNVTP